MIKQCGMMAGASLALFTGMQATAQNKKTATNKQRKIIQRKIDKIKKSDSKKKKGDQHSNGGGQGKQGK